MIDRRAKALRRTEILERSYIWFLVVMWAVIPGIRRVVDWLSGYGSLPAINLLPMIIMVPLLWQAIRRRGYGRDLTSVFWLWTGAFGYALFVAFVSGGLLSSIYDFALFYIPVLGALWVANTTLDRKRIFETLTSACLTVATIASLYGIVQFVSPPAWDVNWANNANLVSIGQPVPFGLRIFSTLNSPAIFATFLVFAIFTSLHRYSLRNWWVVVPLAICCIALGLTLVRAAWLTLALGLVVYGFCCSRRAAFFSFCAFLTLVLVAGVVVLSTLSGGNGSESLTERLTSRLSTFGSLESDSSAISRRQQSNTALREALSEPLGQGLGTVGTSTRLTASDSSTVVDNGYLSRFLELGVVGFLLYLSAIVAALLLTIRRWKVAQGKDNLADIDLLCAAIVVQISLIGGELSGDVHNNLPGVFFWLFVGLALRRPVTIPTMQPRTSRFNARFKSQSAR